MHSVMETIVMSVGGSLIVPDGIDTAFLKNLKTLVENETAQGRRFVLIAGGGKTSRRYADAARDVTELTNDDLDWLGLHATRLNGHLLRTIFRPIAHPAIITNPDDVLDVPKDTSVVIAAGYRPGSSTDYRAVQIAERIGAQKVINLSNIDYVYSDDPRKNESAEKIEETTWSDFRKLIPEEWNPNLSSPFDPIAAKHADELELEVAIINGEKLDELQKYLSGDEFIGTRIYPVRESVT